MKTTDWKPYPEVKPDIGDKQYLIQTADGLKYLALYLDDFEGKTVHFSYNEIDGFVKVCSMRDGELTYTMYEDVEAWQELPDDYVKE